MADLPDPIAEKLNAGVAETKDRQAAASGERLLGADFQATALQRAPAEFKSLTILLRERGAVINRQRTPEIPELRFAEVNNRLEAGKFAIQFEPIPGALYYEVRVIVGLHPNAHVFMALVPNVTSSVREYSATADETGFSWLDNDTNTPSSPEQIVDGATEVLKDLLLADYRGEFDQDN